MSIDTFERLVEWVFSETQNRVVTFILHGGEPTLRGESWLLDSITAARMAASGRGKKARFAIQSNGINVSDSMLQFLAREDVHLGVSIDGPAFASAMRPRSRDAVDTLRRARALGITTGVLTTINETNWQHFAEIYDWLRGEVGVPGFKANVVSSVGRGKTVPELSVQSIVVAQRTIVESMLRDMSDSPLIEDNLSREILRFFYRSEAGDRGSLCHGRPCGAGRTVVGVAHDGRILPCGRFEWDDEQFMLGTVNEVRDRSMSSRSPRETLDAFHQSTPPVWMHCAECAARSICAFGCQAFIVRSASKRNIECEPTQLRYDYYRNNEERLRPLAEILARRITRTEVDTAYTDDELNYADRSSYYDYSDYSDHR